MLSVVKCRSSTLIYLKNILRCNNIIDAVIMHVLWNICLWKVIYMFLTLKWGLNISEFRECVSKVMSGWYRGYSSRSCSRYKTGREFNLLILLTWLVLHTITYSITYIVIKWPSMPEVQIQSAFPVFLYFCILRWRILILWSMLKLHFNFLKELHWGPKAY
jgi:hypothetical protein